MHAPLSPRRAADAIGVSVASIKRWCDEGRIQTMRTVGGHRKITLESLIAFARSRSLAIRTPELLGLDPATLAASTQATVAALVDALLRDTGEEAGRLILARFLEGMPPPELIDHILAPAMHEIGHRWECGRAGVDQERRACGILETVLGDLVRLVAKLPPDAPVAIGGTTEGDHYTLAARAVELVLRDQGWNARVIGVHLPIESLAQAVHRCDARLVWLSCSYLPDPAAWIEAYRRHLQPLLDRRVRIVLGGRALDESIRSGIRYSFCGTSMADLVVYLRGTPRD